MPNVELVWITPEPEKMIAHIARVSNPKNQDNPEYVKLIKYLIRNKHWSPFEMSSMSVKITTSRAIAAQILRHRSFSFQEYSQRYSEVEAFEPIEIRKQAKKNRQSSTEVFDPLIGDTTSPFYQYDSNNNMIQVQECTSNVIDHFLKIAQNTYTQLLNADVAKEVARMILPLATQTTLYMSGTIRSFLHYIMIRTDEHTQKEHREIAQQIESIFAEQLPTVYAAYNEIKQEEKEMRLLYAMLNDGKLLVEKNIDDELMARPLHRYDLGE